MEPSEEKKAEETPVSDVNIRTMEGDLKAAPAEVIQVPETVNQMPAPGEVVGEEKGPSPSKKTALWMAGGAALAIGLGLLGYFVFYPLIFPPEAVAPATEEIEEAAPVAQPIEVHKSLFTKAPSAVAKINLSDLSLLNIAVALQNEAARPLNGNLIKEVEILDEGGGQISFGAYLAQFLPNLPSAKFSDWFEDDFTGYLYYDANGVWPGYVTRIKEGANIGELKAAIAQLESGDTTVFYIVSPGVMGQFKDGKVGAYTTRYSVGSRPGAAFNYGYAGNYLLISTSYNGLKAALPLLGL